VKKPQKTKAPVDNKTSGVKDIPTAQIDALTASGARFASGYVTAPFCAASRAALMIGRYQTRFGFEFNPIGVNQGREICGAYYVSVRRPE